MSEPALASDGRVIGERAQRTRRRLLDATAALLDERGALGLRVVDITRSVGTSPATFYQYFSDVEEAILVLADGTVFRGTSIGADGFAAGEVVFNTAISGYQEILTDPSYCNQIVTLTYPHIGNTGVNVEDVEASRPQVAGLVIRELAIAPSSWRKSLALDELPSPAAVVDYGIDSLDHLGALQHAIATGVTVYDLDRVMGDGPAITRLVRNVPDQPYPDISFSTAYDALEWDFGDASNSRRSNEPDYEDC